MPSCLRVTSVPTCWNASKIASWSAGRDADAGVGHRDLPRAFRAPRVDVDRARRGRELHRVREQVEHDLLHLALVAFDRASSGSVSRRSAIAAALGALAHQRERVVERGAEVELRGLELHPAGLDLGQVEDVVDEREKVLARAVDVVHVVGLLRVELAEERAISISEKPMIALSGVRSSCDMLARNADLCWLAISSWWLFSWISRKSFAFWIAITAWSAKVLQQRDLLVGERDRRSRG